MLEASLSMNPSVSAMHRDCPLSDTTGTVSQNEMSILEGCQHNVYAMHQIPQACPADS